MPSSYGRAFTESMLNIGCPHALHFSMITMQWP